MRFLFSIIISVCLIIAGIFSQTKTYGQTPNQTLQTAVELIKSNKLSEAETMLRGFVKKNPRDTDAAYLLGTLLDSNQAKC